MQQAGSIRDVDVGAIVNRVQRLARLDTTVFDEVRGNAGETIPALLVVVVSTLLAALGGWLWLIIDEPFGLDADTGKILVKEFLLGSVFCVGLWVVWVAAAELLLTKVFSVSADRGAMIRTMGYAAAPAALTLLILIPAVSLGVGLVALVAWFVLTNYAIQSAVPEAAPNQVVLANLGGFLVFAIVMAVLADVAGMAPGVFVHGADLGEYF